MEQFIIHGRAKVHGEITPQGNKNEALPILCAALMNPGVTIVKNVPAIEDIRVLTKLLKAVGADVKISNQGHTFKIDATNITTAELSPELTSPIRGSITLIAPLLARMKKVYLPKPGGDKIGRRRVDTHLLALQSLGAKIEVEDQGYRISAEKLIAAEILLDEASVTATENAVMAAAVADGTSIIENAASEPHVQGLCRFLQAQGVEISGIGSNCLKIIGMKSHTRLKPVEHTIGADYLEVGSFISMAALTKGSLLIKGVDKKELRMVEQVFNRLGITFSYKKGDSGSDLFIAENQQLEIQTDVHGEIPKIDDAPWPGFPADLISIALVTATQCNGTVLIHEKLFESRLFFTDKLISMGAKLVLCDPHRAVIIGPSALHGASMSSPDIRAGMSLLIAAMAAQGESRIQNIAQIDRGYENIDERLQSIGVDIKRVKV